jgi:hypothetical protein
VPTRYALAPLTSQRGAAALLVVLVLLLALTLIVLAMGRVGVQEQTISGNEQRSHKALEAAQAGIEYAFLWLAEHFNDASVQASWPQNAPYNGTLPSHPTPTNVASIFALSDTTPGILDVPNDVTPGSDEQYQVRVVVKDAGNNGTAPETPYIQVTSYARDANDNSVIAAVRQYGIKSELGSAAARSGPPLVMNGCIEKGTGNPDLFPAINGPFAGQAMEVGTEALVTPSCYPDDPRGICPDPRGSGTCPSQMSHMNVHGGSESNSLSGADAAWNKLFPDMSKEEFKNLADYENDLMERGSMTNAERSFIYIDSSDARADDNSDWGFNGNNWHTDLGTGNVTSCDTTTPRQAIHPVVLYFGNGGSASNSCPNINGSTTIWGIVYYEDCTAGGNGWGGGKIFGTAAVESDVEKINSNTVFCGTDDGTDSPPKDDKVFETLVRIPGTWSEL